VALHRPGHSPSDTVFWDPQERVLIGGDHLIGHISSNPLISRPLGGRSGEPGDGRPRALLTYIRSLRETRAMPVDVVLAGHGEPVGDHVALIDERFAMHERRAAKIAELIAERPRSAHEIAQALWGNVAVTQAYLTLCEVLGHVDLLLEREEVHEVEIGGIIRFEGV
jgi:glyoxylase-like metal-dependent hydrolase (beta-lactamase superfamily II)